MNTSTLNKIEKLPFASLLKNIEIYNDIHWIYYRESISDYHTYILISNKGDIVYISMDEYKLENLKEPDDNNYFIKRRIKTDDVALSHIDFLHTDLLNISKEDLIFLVDTIVIEKIRNLLIN